MVCDQRNAEANYNLIDFESRRLLKESEKLIQKSIQEWLNYHSEVSCCSVKGHFLAIEVKSKTGKQSAYQKTFQEYVEKSGGHYIIARDLITVMNKVDELLNATD